MGFGYSTDLSTILTLAKTALTSSPFVVPYNVGEGMSGPFDASQVIVTLARDEDIEKFFHKDTQIVIRPASFPIDQTEVAGGGNYSLAVRGTLSLSYYARLWTTTQTYDLAKLNDASFGVLANWKAILNLFSMWTPLETGSGDCYLIQPARFLSFDVVPNRTAKPGWTRLDSTLSVPFKHALS